MYYSQSLCSLSPVLTNVKSLPLCNCNKDVALKCLIYTYVCFLIQPFKQRGTKHRNIWNKSKLMEK